MEPLTSIEYTDRIPAGRRLIRVTTSYGEYKTRKDMLTHLDNAVEIWFIWGESYIGRADPPYTDSFLSECRRQLESRKKRRRGNG